MPDPLEELASTAVPAKPEDTIPFEAKFATMFGVIVLALAWVAFWDWNRRVLRRTREGELSRNTGWEEPPPDDL